MRVICRCSSHQWRTERARRQLRHRTDRPLATTYVGKIDVELDPSAKPTLQPPTYRGTEVLGPTAVRCRAPLIQDPRYRRVGAADEAKAHRAVRICYSYDH